MIIAGVNDDLTGRSPIDWDKAKAQWPIAGFKPEKLKILERDAVMLSLVLGAGEAGESPVIEELCRDLDDEFDPVARELRILAKHYIAFKNKAARLPKFGKWVSSMFNNKPEYNVLLAKIGQNAAKPTGVDDLGFTISCNPVDILRGAHGHFWTCLGDGGAFKTVLPGVLQECPGIAVAYLDDAEGKMKARCWINHADVDGKDVVQVNPVYGNGFTQKQLANAIAAKGWDVYRQDYGGNHRLKFINNFKRPIHWDALETTTNCYLIAAAAGKPAARAA